MLILMQKNSTTCIAIGPDPDMICSILNRTNRSETFSLKIGNAYMNKFESKLQKTIHELPEKR